MSWLRFFIPVLLLNLLVDVPQDNPEPALKRYARNACRLGMLILFIALLGRQISLFSLGVGLFALGGAVYWVYSRAGK